MGEILYKFMKGQRIAMTQEESDEMHAKWAASKREADGKIYQSERQEGYKTIEEQLDMLWHELNTTGSITNTGDWFLHRQNVKTNHPKP